MRERFWTFQPVNNSKTVGSSSYIHNASLKDSTAEAKKTVSRKRKILYNAPIEWDNKAEDFFKKGTKNDYVY